MDTSTARTTHTAQLDQLAINTIRFFGVDRFGASGPGPVVMREFGFSVENVCRRALALLEVRP
jgi:transketolase